MKEENQSDIVDPEREAIKAKICELVEQGMWFQDACLLSGISRESGHRWRREDNIFDTQVKASRIKYKQKLVAVVNAGSIKKPEVALEMLRIHFPQEYNQVKKVAMVNPEIELRKTLAIIEGEDIEDVNIYRGEDPAEDAELSAGDTEKS